jgi:hypothetical protein
VGKPFDIDPQQSFRLLTIEQAAIMFGVSTKTFRGFVEAWSIPWIRGGLGEKRQRRRFDLDDLKAVKNSQKTIGAAGCPSIKEKAKPPKPPTPLTSSKVDGGLPEILAQRIAAKRNASKTASAKKRGT